MREITTFITEPETCPYLRDRSSQQEVRIVRHLSSSDYSRRLAQGWRRFGYGLFRPSCSGCDRCIAVRVRVREFRPSRSQRRVLRRNRDVSVELGAPLIDDDRLRLYDLYHRERAAARGWIYRSMNPTEYANTFLDNAATTLEFRYRLGGRLVGVAYVGEGTDALNSIYSFADPSLARRSLGTFDVLAEILEAARRGKEYLYLGYHVSGCSSMEYKAGFRPFEALRRGRWEDGEAVLLGPP